MLGDASIRPVKDPGEVAALAYDLAAHSLPINARRC
jgi:hypothetical protein